MAAKSVVHRTICLTERGITIVARIKILQGLIEMISDGTVGVFDIQFVIWLRGNSLLLPSSTSVTLFSVLSSSSISVTLLSWIGNFLSFIIPHIGGSQQRKEKLVAAL